MTPDCVWKNGWPRTDREERAEKYEYERVLCEGIVAERLESHRRIIDRRVADGWRYAGYIPVHAPSI